MPGDSIQVRPADLLAHAARIEGVAAQLDTAKRAGDAVQMGAAAYGKLCAIVPVLLNELQGLLIDGIDTAAHSVHDTGARVRAAADAYQSSDERAAAAHNRIRGAS
jgi:Excreted virulence factor EspC, type VII ESX diderm